MVSASVSCQVSPLPPPIIHAQPPSIVTIPFQALFAMSQAKHNPSVPSLTAVLDTLIAAIDKEPSMGGQAPRVLLELLVSLSTLESQPVRTQTAALLSAMTTAARAAGLGRLPSALLLAIVSASGRWGRPMDEEFVAELEAVVTARVASSYTPEELVKFSKRLLVRTVCAVCRVRVGADGAGLVLQVLMRGDQSQVSRARFGVPLQWYTWRRPSVSVLLRCSEM